LQLLAFLCCLSQKTPLRHKPAGVVGVSRPAALSAVAQISRPRSLASQQRLPLRRCAGPCNHSKLPLRKPL
ncbi:MAG: hypothetical protein K2O74_06100, partial [Eubacteriales bacterium]|nr:hypothetical protein [Eubacteriales bacterium]